MKIPNKIKVELKKYFKEWLSEQNKDIHSLYALAQKSFYEAAWMAWKQDSFIWKFYGKNNLGQPKWNHKESSICNVGDNEGNPMVTIESYLPISRDIWLDLAGFVADKIEKGFAKEASYDEKEQIQIFSKYNENYYASIFEKTFADAPFAYHPNASFAMDYDGL